MGRYTSTIVVPFKVNRFHDERDPDVKHLWNEWEAFSDIGHGWRQIGDAADREYQGNCVYVAVIVKIPPEVAKDVIGPAGEVKSEEDYEKLVRTYPCVELINEGECVYAGAPSEWSLIADKREHLEMFCKDMGIDGEILENAVVQQTL